MTKMNRSYISFLETRQKTEPPKKKSERTREKLFIAAAKVLDSVGFHNMRVGDITKTAEVSDGIFYFYFKDKKDISLTLLENFLSSTHLISGTAAFGSGQPFEQICATNLGWIEGVRANAGLMRSMYQLADEDPEFGLLVYDSNRAWTQRVAHSVIRNRGVGDDLQDAVYFAASSLVGMMDDLLRRLVFYPEPNLIKFLDAHVPNDTELAAALGVLWYNSLYPGEALPADLPPLASKLAALNKSRTP